MMTSKMHTSRFFIRVEPRGPQESELIYMDEHGKQVTLALPPTILEKLMRIFDGAPKAVPRSSGGLITVKPYQLLVTSSEDQPISVKIKVVFKDLERDLKNQIISNKIVHVTKTVDLEDIVDCSKLTSSFNNNFVVDLGLGIIPIHVLQYFTDASGVEWAFFVRHDELERSVLDPSIESNGISIGEVPKEMLRWIPAYSNTQERDFRWARDHIKQLLARGEHIIPDALVHMRHLLLPTEATLAEILQFLRQTLTSQPVRHPALLAEMKARVGSISLSPLDEDAA